MSILQPLINENRGYNSPPNLPAIVSSAGQQLALYDITVFNGFAGSNDIGLFRSLNTSKTKLYTKVGAAAPVLRSDDDIAAGLAVLASGDAILVGSRNPSNLIGLNVTVIGSGTFTYEFWNGSAFVALANIENFGASLAIDFQYLSYLAPFNWAAGSDEGTIDNTLYYVKISAGAGAAATIDALSVGEFIKFRFGVAQNGSLNASTTDSQKPIILEGGEGLVPYFSNSDAANFVEVSYNVLK